MKKDKEELNKEESKETENKKEEKVEKSYEDQILELNDKVKYWQNKYYEAYADMDNLKKRMEKDHQQFIKYRGQGFLEALLPVFDNFYNCFKVTPDDPKLAAYCKGFEMIYNQMVNSLEAEGVKEIMPKVGEKFDHNSMQAVDVVEGEEDDLVMKVSTKGYFLKDRLVRPAMVVVSKKKKEEENKKESEEVEDTSKAN